MKGSWITCFRRQQVFNPSHAPMKTPHTIRSLIAPLLVAALLSGCANKSLRSSVHSIGVSGNVANRNRVTYESAATTTVGIIGAATLGLGPILLATGINAAISSNPKHVMKAAATGGALPLEKMVADAFAAEIPRSGPFTLAPAGGGDATFELKIEQYGLEYKGSIVGVRARLMKNGQCLFSSRHLGHAPETSRHSWNEYKANPELFRIGWQQAAADAARETIDDLVDDFGYGKRGTHPAPAPTSARPRVSAR